MGDRPLAEVMTSLPWYSPKLSPPAHESLLLSGEMDHGQPGQLSVDSCLLTPKSVTATLASPQLVASRSGLAMPGRGPTGRRQGLASSSPLRPSLHPENSKHPSRPRSTHPHFTHCSPRISPAALQTLVSVALITRVAWTHFRAYSQSPQHPNQSAFLA